jgi:hypothetical protein
MLRSAKDLKEMVTDARAKSKGRLTEAARMQLAGTTPIESLPPLNGEDYARTQTGGATYGNRVKASIDGQYSTTRVEEDARQAKLALLASSDKETIESQQKRLLLTKQELDDVKAKFQVLKRNYDSLSLFHAKDNAEF